MECIEVHHMLRENWVNRHSALRRFIYISETMEWKIVKAQNMQLIYLMYRECVSEQITSFNENMQIMEF